MTNDAIRRKIAEACGWTDIVETPHHGMCGVKGTSSFRTVSNYPESHDAMAEAFGTLDAKEQVRFVRELCTRIPQCSKPGDYYASWELFQLVITTPLQKAEAFLRAKGLWEE